MLLAIDAGNSRISFGIFDEDRLVKTFKLPSQKEYTIEDYSEQIKGFISEEINECIISSVVSELDKILQETILNTFGVHALIFSTNLNCGIKLNIENPQTVGVDRIANAVCAKKIYKAPIIVVDAGTATTFDIINTDGEFIGGAIMPGVNIQLKSLSSNTSKLPNLDIGMTSRAIGDNTREAILSGVIRGSAYAIDGIINASNIELNQQAFLVGTGGDIELLSQYMNTKFDIINPNLTLEGLKILHDINNVKLKI